MSENLEARRRGEICFVPDCDEQDPMFPMTRICIDGSCAYCSIIWYCGSHWLEMATEAVTRAREGSFELCQVCGCIMVPLDSEFGPE